MSEYSPIYIDSRYYNDSVHYILGEDCNLSLPGRDQQVKYPRVGQFSRLNVKLAGPAGPKTGIIMHGCNTNDDDCIPTPDINGNDEYPDID